jgi:hypothetical protein
MTLTTQEPFFNCELTKPLFSMNQLHPELHFISNGYLIGAFGHAVRIVADVALGVVREAAHARSLDGYSGGALE